MATATDTRPDPPLPGAKPPGAGRDRPIRGFELWAWLFMRISGLVLLFLAVRHVRALGIATTLLFVGSMLPITLIMGSAIVELLLEG